VARATLTIDLAAIAENWRRLSLLCAPAETAAVVKADAYGLGVAHVAPALWAAGARTFFTALPEEAATVREVLGPAAAIYCFNGMTGGDADLIRAFAIRPLLNSPGQIAAARAAARDAPLPCGLQLDTGMNRLGLEADELSAVLDDPQGLDGLAPDLVVSHLACADDPAHPMNAAQAAAFVAMTAHPRLARLRRSLSATGGALLGPEWRHDLVRPGVGLYGGLPFAEAAPVVRLSVPILQIRAVAPGEAVGYGAAWRAERETRVATISAGYADGLIRAMSGRARVFHGGRALPARGRVSMDLITVDVTEAPDLAPGDALDLLGPHQGVDALAAAAGTIGYEILTSLGSRYARRYEGGETAPLAE